MGETRRIFEWVSDIEDIYQKLIEKAEQENSFEIQDFKEQQEKSLKELLKKNHDLVNLSLESLSEDVTSGIRSFENKIDDALKEIENDYKKKKSKLINQIIEELGIG
jgi:gas vesicle protein